MLLTDSDRVCIETVTSRPVQGAMETVLAVIAKHAPPLPIVTVRTKTGVFLLLDVIEQTHVQALACGKGVDEKIRESSANLMPTRQKVFADKYKAECDGSNELQTSFAFVSRGKRCYRQACLSNC